MLSETLTDAAIGVGICGMFLGIGAGTWYHPTLFAPLLDDWDLTPWAQLLVAPALLVGGWLLALTLRIGWVAGPGFALVAAGVGALCRHEYRDTETAWPSRVVSRALVALGTLLCVYGFLAAL
ncbi:hypothetical protein ACOZ4I_03715 [Haloarcula salina]|uniref:hypothetical protein n=1 Tax=Haloarcula salina TaxID=1429914 RepID=UPI003C705877